MFKKYIPVLIVGALALLPVAAQAEVLPPGRPITLDSIADIIELVTRFLIYISGIIAVAVIVISGIMRMYAGDSPDGVKKAGEIFKSGIIGALIVFGVGTILATIRVVVTGQFFGF